MGKPEFDLRIKVKPSSRLKRKPETKAVDAVYRKDIKAKKSIKAVKQYKENNKQGQPALKTGMFPLIKDNGTIDRKLGEKLTNGKK